MDFPLTCVTVPVCHLSDSWLWWDKRDLFLKGLLAKSYNISQVFNPGVTTSKTAHFSQQVHDVPLISWPLCSVLVVVLSLSLTENFDDKRVEAKGSLVLPTR